MMFFIYADSSWSGSCNSPIQLSCESCCVQDWTSSDSRKCCCPEASYSGNMQPSIANWTLLEGIVLNIRGHEQLLICFKKHAFLKVVNFMQSGTPQDSSFCFSFLLHFSVQFLWGTPIPKRLLSISIESL